MHRIKTNNKLIIGGAFLFVQAFCQADSLELKSLQLQFDTLNKLSTVEQHSQLQAKLTITYNGSGLLQGRWLLAEPGSTEGKSLYKTLSLVRENLTTQQRSYIDSPELPTIKTGKYNLKFCVTKSIKHQDANKDPQCPSKLLSTAVGYQVVSVAE